MPQVIIKRKCKWKDRAKIGFEPGACAGLWPRKNGFRAGYARPVETLDCC